MIREHIGKTAKVRIYRKDMRQRRTKTVSGRKTKSWRTNKNLPEKKVLGSKQWVEHGITLSLPEERRVHLKNCRGRWGRNPRCTWEEWQIVNEEKGRQGRDHKGPCK